MQHEDDRMQHADDRMQHEDDRMQHEDDRNVKQTSLTSIATILTAQRRRCSATETDGCSASTGYVTRSAAPADR
jgi:hypothetical protein